MPLNYINKGTAANNGTGTSARLAADIINNNFDYLLGLIIALGSNSNKITLTATEDGQTAFNIESKPLSVDVIFNDAWKAENYAFEYNPLTGDLLLINGFYLDTDEVLDVRTYGDSFQKQILEATEEGQTIFYYSGAPSNIDVIVNDSILKEGAAYIKTNFSTGNYTTLTNGVSIGSSVQINKY